MARAVTPRRKALDTTLAWAVGLPIFLPILWTVLTSFRTDAIASPPVFPGFAWALENCAVVQERSDCMKVLINAVIIDGASTLPGVIIAMSTAWSMAFAPSRRTRDILLWTLAPRMLPAVGCPARSPCCSSNSTCSTAATASWS